MGYKRLDAEDFLVSADSVSQTVWTDRVATLSTFFTSSTQEQASVSGEYYLAVYQTASTSISAEPQFDISYGDSTGGGGVLFNSSIIGKSPTTTVYGQFRTLVLEDENSSFTFGAVNPFTSTYIYVISVDRARYKEKLLPGSLSLKLQNGSNTLTLTDNSLNVTIPSYLGSQRAYQVVRQGSTPGTNDGFSGGETQTRGSYGLFLPDTGLIILNGSALDLPPSSGVTSGNHDIGIGLSTVRTNTEARNPSKLFKVIKDGGIFKLNCEETLSSDFVFVRVRNSEYNYTENPSFLTGATGEVYHNSSINNPQVYVTTIGLYNDANELLGVAKLSKPLLKDFTKEALVRVKLDF
jgi:hypothetical protein